jgi:AraC family transcriptional regulator
MKALDELQLEFKEQEAIAEIQTARSWRGITAQFSRLQLPAEYEFKWDGHSHYLAHHDLVLLDGEMEVLGEKPIAGRDLRDQMTFVPLGQTIEGWSKPTDRLNTFTVVCFDPAAMEEELQAEFNGTDPRPNIYFKDTELGTTMRKLGRLMADDTRPTARVYAETLGLTAALEMFRIVQADTKQIKTTGTLSQSQAKAVKDYIEENLARDIGLDDLAAVCNLTRFHFSRAFKTTFGQPPYRYLNTRRVELAKQMLATTRFAVADIALSCGFNGVSQFGRSFKDVVGETPLEFRRRS